MTLLEATSAYWTSPEGIQRRTEMLGEDFTFAVHNNALQAYGRANEVAGFEWEGSIDERTCNYCDSQIGRYYRIGMFLPSLPAHSGCRCGWRLISYGEKPLAYAPKTKMRIDPTIQHPKDVEQRANAILRELPTKHIEGITRVTIEKDLGVYRWNDHESNVAGNYNEKTSEIKLREDTLANENVARSTIYHEVGHNVYNNLPIATKKGWQFLWKFEARRTPSNLPTDYSKIKPSEGFAECYQIYAQPEIRDRQWPTYNAIKGFLGKKVFGES